MPFDIRIGRVQPAKKSNDLRNDAQLWQAATELGDWLAEQDLQTMTAARILQFTLLSHPNAQMTQQDVWYEWVWSRAEQMWFLVCHDQAAITYVDDASKSPVQISTDSSASYA